MPVSVCPECGSFYREYGQKEWVQMSPVKKYLSIAPRAYAFAFFGSLLLDVATAGIFFWITEALHIQIQGNFILASFPFRMLFGNFLLLHYVITLCTANGEKFRKRLVASIRRTRNPDYRQVLEGIGKLYTEDMPWAVPMSRKGRAAFEAMLAEKPVDTELRYPTMFESIQNI